MSDQSIALRKAKYRDVLLQHLSDVENEFPRFREHYGPLIGVAPVTLRKYFTSADFVSLESEALENRRSSIARLSARVDLALLKAAESGDTAAMSLFYKRLEGWNEKTAIDLQASGLENWK